MMPDPNNPDLVVLARKVFVYDDVLTTWGWEKKVFYDVEQKLFYIQDFPSTDYAFEMPSLPLGSYEIVAEGNTYKVRVYE